MCFDAIGSPATTEAPDGYASQCYNGVPWDGGFYAPTPAGAGACPDSRRATAINASLQAGGAISGTVTGGGNPIAGVVVHVFNGSGAEVTTATTGADGTYTVGGLAPSTSGDDVCFDPGQSSSLYAGQCYSNRRGPPGSPWSQGQPAAGSSPVTVSAGTTTTGIDATLSAPVVQGVQGTVTAANGGAGLVGVSVYAYDKTDTLVGSGVYDLRRPIQPGAAPLEYWLHRLFRRQERNRGDLLRRVCSAVLQREGLESRRRATG